MINHDFGNDVQTPLFWACGCETNYVQPRSKTHCPHCNCWEANSRQAYCTEVLDSPRKFRDEKRTSSPAYAERGESTTSERGMHERGSVFIRKMEWTRISGMWHLCSPASVTYKPHSDGDFVAVAMAFASAEETAMERYLPILAILLDGRFHYIGGEDEATKRFGELQKMMEETRDQRELVLIHSEDGVIDSKL